MKGLRIKTTRIKLLTKRWVLNRPGCIKCCREKRRIVVQRKKWRLWSLDSDDYFFSEHDRILKPTLVDETTSSYPDQEATKEQPKWKLPSWPTEENKSRLITTLFDPNEADLPKGWMHRVLWLWERPVMKLGRLTVFFTQLPSAFSVLAPQVFAVASKFALPMLPPLLVAAGILLRSVWVNAGYLFPRLYLTTFILWAIWLLNSFISRLVGYLTKQGTVQEPTAHTVMNWVEGLTLVMAGLVILSLFGVNLSGLLLPAGVCLALAARDLSHNFLAGLVLFLAQPFRVGDEVSIQSLSKPLPKMKSQWFRGTCEKVDLRYTILRQGKYKLYVPNASFVTKEFLVVDQTHEDFNATETPDENQESSTSPLSCPMEPSFETNFPQTPLRVGHLDKVIEEEESSENGVDVGEYQ